LQNTVEELETLVKEEHSNIAGVVVIKNNQLAYEYCANGNVKQSTTHVASVTKSILSALVGIAIDKGAIKSVEDKVLDYFPRYQLKRGEKTLKNITIKHLLTMTAPYKYKYEPYTKIYSSDDWTTSTLDLLGGKGNIGVFKYTTVGLQVLSGVLTNATNQSIREFSNENLFNPLGINVSKDVSLEDKEQHFSFIKDDVVSGWVVDPKGVNTAGWGLTLTVADMAKFGQLYLNKGTWKNNQIISSQWINDSIIKQSSVGERNYGYLWWVIDSDRGIYAAIGDSGNIIYVSTEHKMVIAIASRYKPSTKNRVDFIQNHIEPVFKSYKGH